MLKNLYIIIILFISNSIYSNEVKIINDIPGYGLEIVNHSKVSVHYIGRLENNIEFDNSYKRDQLFNFQIGVRKVIPGWETGLLGMKEGGKRTIFIPYQLAYGKNGAGDLIPPESNLIFEIELFKVTPPKYKEIDNLQLKLAMTDQNFKIIDIRNLNKIIQTGIIPGSFVLTAFDEYGNFQQNFLNKYGEIVYPEDKVIFVSEEGIISSILANGFVEQLNQKNIFHLKGGIIGLKEKNFIFQEFKN
tara:strand:- start:798 stop:1535 length:738 start_codon:yes stop_codon:yes gene_type:complete